MNLTRQDRAMKTLSLILSYPSLELQHAMPRIGGVIVSDMPRAAAARRALRLLVENLTVSDIYKLQESCVMLFDRSRTLFEHGHDESRHRGVPSDAGGNYREGC